MSTKHRNKVVISLMLFLLVQTFWAQAQALRLKTDSGRDHFERARSYDASGDSRAEQEYRQAIADRAGIYPDAWRELSAYLARRQRFDEAASAWRSYLNQSSHKGRSVNPQRLRRLDRGAELKAQSDRNEVLSVEEMVELVSIVEGFGSRSDAVPYAEKALKLHPESTTVLVALAKLIRAEQKERGLELLNRAVALRPNDPAIYTARGWNYYWNQGKSAEAEADFRKALELSNGSHASAWAGLGDALAGQERRDEAVAAYRKYLSLRPKSAAHNDGEIKKSIEKLRNDSSQP